MQKVSPPDRTSVSSSGHDRQGLAAGHKRPNVLLLALPILILGVAAHLSAQGPLAPSDVKVLTEAPSGGVVPDSSWIPVAPGESIQTKVSAYPAGTTFYIEAGTHRRQSVKPKDGNRFIGERGAILDGEGVAAHAFETLSHVAKNVTLKGLVIRNYVPPQLRGAVQGDNGPDWIIEDNEIHDNANHGVRPGARAQVRRNRIYRNGKVGIAGYMVDGVLIEDNEVFENNYSQASETAATAEGSGIKFVACHDLVVRRNHVHHNYGKGIWTDTNYLNTLVEQNLVTDNRDAGIWHEVSYNAIIRYNTVERNGGTEAPGWLNRGGINVTNSADVEIYGNTLRDNANGIGIMQAAGYPTSGPYGAYEVRNLVVRDNVVGMQIGRTGLANNLGDQTYYTSRNNQFVNNSYYLGKNSAYYLWDERNLTETQWKGYGNDTTGTFVR
jgi:parallel beta-helix repeat protein